MLGLITLTAQIDWDESKIENRVIIRTGVDAQLDEHRRTLKSLPSMLAHIADSIVPTVPPEFTSALYIVYFPQLGYLCGTPVQDVQTDNPEDGAPEGWEFQARRCQYAELTSTVRDRGDGLLQD